MKKLIVPFIALLTLTTFSACEELAITFEDVVIEETLDITGLIPKSSNILTDELSYTFSESMTFGMDNADNGNNAEESLSEYLGSLSSVTIKEMAFTIDEILSSETLLVNSLNISISAANGEIYSESFENIRPGVATQANITTEIINALSDVLLANEELTLSASGEVTGSIQEFSLITRIVSDIEANALDAVNSVL